MALVDRIIATPPFSKSERLISFLLHVCRMEADGRSAEISEQEIGASVFGRSKNYDPSIDGIVRSHASRLRIRLDNYFDNEGNTEHVRLSIPRGAYVPIYEPRAIVEPEPFQRSIERPDRAPDLQPALSLTPPASRKGVRRYWWVFAIVACLVLLAVAALRSQEVTRLAVVTGLRSPSDLLWNAVFVPGKSTTLVVGDAGVNMFENMAKRQVTAEEYSTRSYLKEPMAQTPPGYSWVPLAVRSYTPWFLVGFAARMERLPQVHDGQLKTISARDLTLNILKNDQLVLVGRYSGQGDSAITIEGTVNGAKRKFTYEINFPRGAEDHEFIPRLWATRRVGYLLDEIRLRGESTELRDEVTELARKYGIVTPYTAYLIVEDEARRNVPLAVQSLPQLYSDSLARKDAAANWDSFKMETDGSKAVSGARYGYELKNAAAPTVAAANSMVESDRALGLSGAITRGGNGGVSSLSTVTTTPAEDSKVRLAQYSQQGQFVGGRNFYQNTRNEWVDENAQKAQNAKRQRIQFNSKEYFAFAAKERRALPWLALGQNVQFVLDDTLYEIYDTNN